MKLASLIICTFVTVTTFGFTLVSDPPTKMSSSSITVNVSNDDCDQSGLTKEDILSLVADANDQYWNRATTSAIELKKGSILGASLAAADHSTVLAATATNTITIVCSTHADMTATTLGTGGLNGSSQGAVRINNNTAGILSNIDETKATIAHEIGHALGLHHSSEERALMYYSALSYKEQKYLAQDDIDGITYLYPHESELGIMGSCGTVAYVASKNNDFFDGPGGNFISALSLGFILILLLTKLSNMTIKISIPRVEE